MLARILGCLVPVAVLLAACDAGDQAVDAARAPAVVVYAGVDRRDYLDELFARYTRETGVPVVTRYADSAALVDDVVADSVAPPADLLWTADLESVWRAAEEGGLRPLAAASIDPPVPAILRDPDDFWVAIAYRAAVIVFDPAVVAADELGSYRSLAKSVMAGSLCLAPADETLNRAVVSGMIAAHGQRAAEVAVRGWIANLGRPVFDSVAGLLDALEAGDCQAAIAPSDAVLSRPRLAERLRTALPVAPAISVEGLGIGRHARNPAGAAALATWLLETERQAALALAAGIYPANPEARVPPGLPALPATRLTPVAIAAIATNAEAARLLAERARYQ